MFGRDPLLQKRLQPLQDEKLDPAATVERLQIFLDAWGQAIKWVMPLVMRNLAIAQQRDKERYKLVRGGGWNRCKASFYFGDNVLLKPMQPKRVSHASRT